MGAITGTKSRLTELSAGTRILTVTATVAASSDTITLTEASHGTTSIVGILGVTITGGLDAAFSYLQCSYSGAVLTIASFEQDGTVATDFTGTTIEAALLVA